MPPVGFEPTIPAGERPQTYTLDGAATGTGSKDLKKERETRPIAGHVSASTACKYSSFSYSGGQAHGRTETDCQVFENCMQLMQRMRNIPVLTRTA